MLKPIFKYKSLTCIFELLSEHFLNDFAIVPYAHVSGGK